MVDIVPPPTTDINIYLRQGAANFHSGRHQAAFDAFEVALKLAKQQGDCSAERVCKQNIGALYIAVSQPDQGLQHLLTALPSGNEAVDPQSLGDLYFNLGTGYEMIGNLSEASRHFIASAKEYHIIEECVVQEAEAYTRGAQLLQQLGGSRKAAQMFHLAADCYMKVSDYVYAATDLCQEANSLITVGCYDDGLRAANECMILCQRITSYEMRGS
jgi:tetratricopeptide (TPR) repeat protein